MRVAQQPTGKLTADPELSAAAVAATERARLAQVAAASSDDIARARMAANRVPFRSGSVAIGANVAALPATSGNVSGPFVG